ncbi:hypothetical protein [Antarctobacter heliothermus]|uniref:Uncharacterized protein n=1 Tax=Antarctobacter heliothermus TaxID=74033 RepID=A0A239BH63_9RHOB|nr:hypothetical protein [Antarctobacter heliothermus]SNS07136.1 hypothetical protein SAMN04488078_1003116 [Antarctobacter heliothermus]
MTRPWPAPPVFSVFRLLLWMGGALALFIVLSDMAQAATVREGQEPCAFVIDGPIANGDFEALSAFKGDAEFWSQTGYGFDPILCLNSEGGSLSEGARIARFVYDHGLQTRVGDGSICYSVCAIIFMMGNKHAGPTTVEENRILHVGGDLAFHSPSIVIDGAQSYGARELKQAYSLGIESILNIVIIANSQRPFESGAMMHPGLIRGLLETPANQLYHIRTIEQALSWDIGLEGVPEHLPQFSIQRQMVCENGLMRGFRRPSEIYELSSNNFMTSGVFDLRPLNGSAEYRLLPDYGPVELEEGIVYGYRYWTLPVECRVQLDGRSVRVCGNDSSFDHAIGDCQADRFVTLPHYARYHPMTEFNALWQTGIAADVLRSAHCTLRLASGPAVRNEPCTQAIDVMERAGRKFAKHTLHWDSGDRTVIEIAATPYFNDPVAPEIYRIDGVAATPHDDSSTCLKSVGTGNTICVTDR